MNNKEIRIGVIGAGGNACNVHIPKFLELPDVTITHVCNRSYESGQLVAKKFNIPHIAHNWMDLIINPEIDAILIGTWPNMHKEATIAALQANKHVLCEARMAMDLKEAKEMLATLKKSTKVGQLVPARFTFLVDNTIRRLINENAFGKILHIDVKHNTAEFLDRSAPMTWRQDITKSGMNILSMGIWYESIMRWAGEAKEVFAAGRIVQPVRYDAELKTDAPIKIVDHIDICATMKSGATTHFQFSSITGLSRENGIWIYGEKATAFFDFSKQMFLYGVKNSSLEPYDIPESDQTFWQVEENFINSIRTKAPVTLTSFADGVKYMAFTEAVNKSLELKKFVQVESYD